MSTNLRVFLAVGIWLIVILLGVVTWSNPLLFVTIIVVGGILKTLYELYGQISLRTKRADKLINLVLGRLSKVLSDRLNIPLRTHISTKHDDGYIRIKYAYNMGRSPDKQIQLREGEGCMGCTWARAKRERNIEGTYADLTKIGEPGVSDWNFPLDQNALIPKALKWIYSVPIFGLAEKGIPKLFALYTIDSTKKIEPDKHLDEIAMYSEAFASILGILLQSLEKRDFFVFE